MDGYAVATADEAVLLRRNDIKKMILILGVTHPSRYQELIEEEIRPAIFTMEQAKPLSDMAVRLKKTAKIHLALDTGMRRIGMEADEAGADLAAAINLSLIHISWDKELITDYLYEVPRGWQKQFVEDGWEFLFYKKKQYFSAPSTSSGIYYVRYSTDRRYKKVKFCDADSVLQAFGEYVCYRAGCYRENSTMMQAVSYTHLC